MATTSLEEQTNQDKEVYKASSIPDVIIEDILSRLPVKPLCRFRCISKSWNTMIRDPSFVEMHLSRSKKTSLKLMVCSNFKDKLPDSIEFYISNISVEIDFCNRFDNDLFGSCNGLLLLCHCADPYADIRDDHLWLYNPSTRERKQLPEPPSEYIEREALDVHYGLGYSEHSKDFKIVRIRSEVITKVYTIPAEVTVFSLRSNSWKTVPETDWGGIHLALDGPCPGRAEAGVLVNGALHWRATDVSFNSGHHDETDTIVAFDIEKNSFSELPYPDYNEEEDSRGISVAALDGKLCLICRSETEDHVWMMKDYGVGKSWTKFFCIGGNQLIYFDNLLCYTNKGADIMLSDGNLQQYNIKNKTLQKVYDLQHLYPGSSEIRATTYMESLLALNLKKEAVGEGVKKETTGRRRSYRSRK